MKYLPLFLLLFLAGCATSPSAPERKPAYWKQYVEDNGPSYDENLSFFPEGRVERDVPLGDEPFAYKFVEMKGDEPLWVVHLKEQGDGYFIFKETWNDKGEPRSRMRKLDFQLSDKEYESVRDAILASGFLSIRNEYVGDGETTWHIGIRVGMRDKAVTFTGAYPDEARRIVTGVYDIIVKPRYADMVDAPPFPPDNPDNKPAYKPLD